MLDGAMVVGQSMQPNRQHFARRQVAGRRQFLSATNVLMRDAREIDGRPLAAMHLFDRDIVIVQGPELAPFPAAAAIPLRRRLSAARRRPSR